MKLLSVCLFNYRVQNNSVQITLWREKMKKFTTTFFLVSILFLTTTALAEGDIPNGGKSCTENCLVAENTSVEISLPSLIVKIQESLRFLFG